jgi:hypothetical protein
VTGYADTRSAMDVESDITLTAAPRLSGMHANADMHRPIGERMLGCLGRRDGIAGTTEGKEEGVPLRVDLNAAVTRHHIAHDLAMAIERCLITIAEVREQPSRALDITKEERHGASRKVGDDTAIIERRPHIVQSGSLLL